MKNVTLQPFEIPLSKLIWNGVPVKKLTKSQLLEALAECASLLIVERDNLARVNRLLDMELTSIRRRDEDLSDGES